MRIRCIGYAEDYNHIPREFTLGKYYDVNDSNRVKSDNNTTFKIESINGKIISKSIKGDVYQFENSTIKKEILQRIIFDCAMDLEYNNATKGEIVSKLFDLSNVEIV